MPIGKDSIQKRVAKNAPAATPATEVKEPVTESKKEAQAPAKPAAKKSAPKKQTAKKAENAPAKKKTAKKSSAKKAPAKKTATTVIADISPEVVEKTVGHPEGSPKKPVKIGEKLPTYLL